jgi:hypothetical protein
LATRTDNVTAALYNVTTHATYIYRPDIDEVTASMEKIDILAVLLWECQNAHRALTAKEMSLATKMIEYSDNNAAEQLWVDDGQLPSVTKFNDDLHYSQSITNWDWGLFDTTPHDQLNLLKTILFPNKYLTPASQAYEQNLMENVVDYERFGIPTGVPTKVPRVDDRLAGEHRRLRAPQQDVLPRGRDDGVQSERGLRQRGRGPRRASVLELRIESRQDLKWTFTFSRGSSTIDPCRNHATRLDVGLGDGGPPASHGSAACSWSSPSSR